MRKIFAALVAAAIVCACVPLVSGCGVSIEYELNAAGDGYVVKATGYAASLKGELEIPETYGVGSDCLPVKEIADQAFAGASVTKVVLPAGIEKIGTAAFSYNSSLTEVVFAEESALTEIAWGAFGYCTRLREIDIPSGVTEILGMAFYGCTSLSSVTLPEGLETIGTEAFESCSSLENIDFPESLTTIGNLAFYQAGLTEVVIPAGVRDIVTQVTDEEGEISEKIIYGIGVAAFHTNENLTKAVILGSIQTVRSGAFGYCTSLSEVYLPASVTKVEGATFTSEDKFYCGHAFHSTALTDVYFAGDETQWSGVEISNVPYVTGGTSIDNSALLNATLHYNSLYGG